MGKARLPPPPTTDPALLALLRMHAAAVERDLAARTGDGPCGPDGPGGGGCAAAPPGGVLGALGAWLVPET